jgi:hypothetical protein
MKTSEPIARISVLSSGKVLLNGVETDLTNLNSELKSVKSKNGIVWYYRENAAGDPPPVFKDVLDIIADNNLPISLSTKADFSNYVDENGQIKQR